MSKFKPKKEEVHVYLTAEEKREIQYLADKSKKSVSQYLIDSGLSVNGDSAKVNFYGSINSDLAYMKRMIYVLSKLTLLVVNNQYKNEELVKKFYDKALEEAEQHFGKSED